MTAPTLDRDSSARPEPSASPDREYERRGPTLAVLCLSLAAAIALLASGLLAWLLRPDAAVAVADDIVGLEAA